MNFKVLLVPFKAGVGNHREPMCPQSIVTHYKLKISRKETSKFKTYMFSPGGSDYHLSHLTYCTLDFV